MLNKIKFCKAGKNIFPLFVLIACINLCNAQNSFGFRYKLSSLQPLCVVEVMNYSPAYKAGLQAGDSVLTVANINFYLIDEDDIAAEFAKLGDGEHAITFKNNGVIKTVKIKKAPFASFNNICYSGNCINGKGVFLDKLSYAYEGNFINGKLEGKGIWRSTNGHKYEGNFVNNEFNGKGTYTSQDGEYYIGEFKNRMKTGTGKLYNNSGKLIQEGTWFENAYKGKAKPTENIVTTTPTKPVEKIKVDEKVVAQPVVTNVPKPETPKAIETKKETDNYNINECWAPLYRMAIYIGDNKTTINKNNIETKLSIAKKLRDSCYNAAKADNDKNVTQLMYCFLNDKIISDFIEPKEANDKKINDIVINALKERLVIYEDLSNKLPLGFSLGGLANSYIKQDNESNLSYVNYYLYICYKSSNTLLANNFITKAYEYGNPYGGSAEFMPTYTKIEDAYYASGTDVNIATSTQSQLTYLGDDEVEKKIDGYAVGFKTRGFEEINNQYFFTTPNGHIYQTQGTIGTTSVFKKFPPQHLLFFSATKKYLLYGYNADFNLVNYNINQTMYRYDPTGGNHAEANTVKQSNNNSFELQLEVGRLMPVSVNELFVNYEKDKTFIRTFNLHNSNELKIYALHDEGAHQVNEVYSCDFIISNMEIGGSTKIGYYKNQVYFNGTFWPKDTKYGYETGVTVAENSLTAPDDYKFKTQFVLKNSGATIYEHFLRTKTKIYSLLKIDKETSFNMLLYNYRENGLYPSVDSIKYKADDWAAEMLDGEAYISCTGKIWKFNERKSSYDEIYTDKSGKIKWTKINGDNRFLKAGNFLMYDDGNTFFAYNMQTKISTAIKAVVQAKEPNSTNINKTKMYAGKNSFYFMNLVDGKEVFTQYNPANNIYTPIVFPEFQKQIFGEIKTIYHLANKFIFLTSYIDKKDNPVYKMFMYTE